MTVATGVLGRPLWYELMTTDMKAAEAFYKKVVGWTSSAFENSPQPYTMFHRSADAPVAPDITSATERITANGGQILNGPMEVPGGDWVVNAMDPQGAAFALHSKKK